MAVYLLLPVTMWNPIITDDELIYNKESGRDDKGEVLAPEYAAIYKSDGKSHNLC